MIGEKIVEVAVLPSTNDYMKEMWHKLPHGTVVVAAMQTRGRGRFGRVWHSPEGGLWFSVLFKPRKLLKPHFFTRACSVAVVRALKKFGIESRLKWPNDVYCDGKKIAGILTESVFEEDALRAIIVGIGINVNNDLPDHLIEKSVTMLDLTGKTIDTRAVLKCTLSELRKLYVRYNRKPEALTRIWKALLIQKEGSTIEFVVGDSILKGTLLKIKEDCLFVRTARGDLEVRSTEILSS